jgi:glutaminyl-tRNA synthetase
MHTPEHTPEKQTNFIEDIIIADLKNNTHDGRVLTRFPPEPNGYLHIGHSKSICLNFGLAKQFGGKTNLRFDDTNPTTEETEYVESIKADIKWLGFTWDAEFYASDYFEQLFEYAKVLINKGLAYIDDSTVEEIAALKGDLNTPGKNSPFRDRPIAENLEIFNDMRAGKYADGTKVLRAKIDMANPNLIMRDPVIYRIKHAHHHRTGNAWCIYPMYDFAHGQSDSIEKITHSVCTLEFVPHRALYDWCIQNLEIFPSKQYEFARGNVSYTITSKRKLLQLVNEKLVSGWDDPLMPTISGYRRRGYTANSLRNFWEKAGIAKRDNVIEHEMLDFCLREDLNKIALRRMAVLNPIKVIITNYPEDTSENLPAENNPEDETTGHRNISFSNTIYIEQDDFMIDPPKKYFRLAPGMQVRLKHAYIITCERFETDDAGNVTTVYCTYLPESKSGHDTSGVKVKGTLHWVDANACEHAEVRLYDRLFTVENPAAEDDFLSTVNKNAVTIIPNAVLEKSLGEAQANQSFQFFRLGYFCLDKDSTDAKKIFNKTIGLKDSWAKEMAKV